MIRYDILQGSDEWHQIRYGKITGTSSKGLFVDSDTLLNDLIACRLEPFKREPDSYVNDAMARGNELEPFGRMAISRKAKVKFKEAGWIQSDIELLGISPDGITECETIACEIKCPSRSVHIETLLADEIPLKNIHQCLHYFTVNPKLKELHFASFRPECQIRLFHKVLTPDSLINLGTKAKPVIKPVSEFAKIARLEAENLETQINDAIKKLSK
jgi:hypothetical protein